MPFDRNEISIIKPLPGVQTQILFVDPIVAGPEKMYRVVQPLIVDCWEPGSRDSIGNQVVERLYIRPVIGEFKKSQNIVKWFTDKFEDVLIRWVSKENAR